MDDQLRRDALSTALALAKTAATPGDIDTEQLAYEVSFVTGLLLVDVRGMSPEAARDAQEYVDRCGTVVCGVLDGTLAAVRELSALLVAADPHADPQAAVQGLLLLVAGGVPGG